MADEAEALLAFWFGDCEASSDALAAQVGRWFGGGPDVDAAIAREFGPLAERAGRGELDGWQETPRGALALVIALDQLPRNLHRGGAQAFAHDARARTVAERAIERGFDARLSPAEAMFLYLPFEHAEDRAHQDRCVTLFRGLCERTRPELRAQFEGFFDYAVRHRDVIARFGRFPHRNATLGRAPTDEEAAWLAAGGDDFSGGGDADR